MYLKQVCLTRSARISRDNLIREIYARQEIPNGQQRRRPSSSVCGNRTIMNTTGRNPPHCSRATQRYKRPLHIRLRGLRINLIFIRIMRHYTIARDWSQLPNSQSIAGSLQTIAYSHAARRTLLLSFFFYFFVVAFRPTIRASSIDVITNSINRPRVLSRHPARSTHDCGVSRSAINPPPSPHLPRTIDARDDIRPRSGATRDKSSQMFYLFHFLPF